MRAASHQTPVETVNRASPDAATSADEPITTRGDRRFSRRPDNWFPSAAVNASREKSIPAMTGTSLGAYPISPR